MNKLEELMNNYPQLSFTFTSRMPDFQGAMIINNQVFINQNRSYTKNLEDVAEEIGHYETTAGNIIEQNSYYSKKQETEARRYGHMILVNLDGLIECYKAGMRHMWELADFFECDTDYILRALDTFRVKKGNNFSYHGYWFDLSSGLNIEPIHQKPRGELK